MTEPQAFPGPGIPPRIWERILLCRPGKACYDARLIGYIRGVSLLVTEPVLDGVRMNFLEGEPVEVRMFSGCDIQVFDTKVSRICIAPVHYLHLDYPRAMKLQPLRRSPWVDLGLPGEVSVPGAKLPILIRNLSDSGARFMVSAEIGEGTLQLGFPAEIDGLRHDLALAAKVVHRKRGEGGMHEYAVAFQDLRDEDRLWLKCLVLGRMTGE